MTERERYDRLCELFAVAYELDPAARATVLEERCGDDAELRAEVEAMLARHGEASALREAGDIDERITLNREVAGIRAESPGTVIGRYKLLQPIGEGGFGSVYMAEQTEPVHRKVALKIIKLGMDTKQVIARFEAERQALAMMDHPNIARVLDAGATDSGRPYFVMDLVNGVPITEYCDTHGLSNTERLDLFVDVCHSVQHAHQKGIIHRDIKPSNVLVTLHDGRPVPKVIDFGIAKATNARLTEKTMFTEFRQLIGTPAYMSPEQAEMSGLDVDTRSDIYSLGVLLYELLTGMTPFDPERLRSAAYEEIRRIIREEEPEKPSTRLSSLAGISGDGAPNDETSSIEEIARQRHDDPAHLTRSLRGDLDWIVMKCLEKDRTRRYETADGLAMEIERHQKHEPVVAGPPSAAYRLKKLIRRQRGPFVVAAAFVVLLAAGAVAIISLWQRAEANAVEATRQAEMAEAVNAFLNDDLLAAVAPSAQAGRGRDVIMRDVLDEAAKRIEQGDRFGDKPLVEASIRLTLGDTYYRLGEYDMAEDHLERALALHKAVLGEEHHNTLASATSLVRTRAALRRFDEAEELLLKTIEAQQRVVGDEHPSTLSSMGVLAWIYQDQGRSEEAVALHRQVLKSRRRILGAKHPATVRTMEKLGGILRNHHRYEEAEPLLLEAMEYTRDHFGPESVVAARSMAALGELYHLMDQIEKAEAMAREVLEIKRRVLGAEHLGTVWSMHSLAAILATRGAYEEAAELKHEAMEVERKVLGSEDLQTLRTMFALAKMREEQGRQEDARTLFREIWEHFKERHVDGYDAILQLSTAVALAKTCWRSGESEQAKAWMAEVVAVGSRPGISAWIKMNAAGRLLNVEPPELRDPENGLLLARGANEMTGNEAPAFLIVLSRAWHLNGETARAIEAQRRALQMLPAEESIHRRDLEMHLEALEAALEAQPASEDGE